MSNSITLTQIRNAARTSGISIADIILAIDEAQTVAAKPARTTPRKPTVVKSDDTAAWRKFAASNAQIDRIERAEEAILESGRKRGIALILRGDARNSAVGNAGNASDYYKALASFTRKFDIRF